MTQRLTFSHGRSGALTVGIEPWADVVVIPPHGRVDFEVDQPTELEVGLNEDGTMTIGIVGDSIRLIAADSVRRITDDKGEYAPRDEPPADSAGWRAIWAAAPDKG